MPADITPEQARSEIIENLIGMANQYRVGTGAHTVVTNEINRREELKKNIRKLLVAFCLGLIGLLFWWLRT
jgi:hypothetical protein